VGRQIPLLTAIVLSPLSVWQTGTPMPIEVRVPSHVCSAPSDMKVTVLIPQHPDNRSASVVWSYNDSTELPIGRNSSQVEFTVSVGKFDKGDHTVYAVLVREKDGQQKTFQDSQHISVR
jgi:hypothetical protein